MPRHTSSSRSSLCLSDRRLSDFARLRLPNIDSVPGCRLESAKAGPTMSAKVLESASVDAARIAVPTFDGVGHGSAAFGITGTDIP